METITKLKKWKWIRNKTISRIYYHLEEEKRYSKGHMENKLQQGRSQTEHNMALDKRKEKNRNDQMMKIAGT